MGFAAPAIPTVARHQCRSFSLGIESARVVVLIAVVVLAIFGVVRLGRDLEPRQRVVLVLVLIAAIAYALLRLVQLGYLGQRSD